MRARRQALSAVFRKPTAVTASATAHATDTWGTGQARTAFIESAICSTTWPRFTAAALQIDHGVADTPQTSPSLEPSLLAMTPNVFGRLPEIAADSRYGFIFGTPARLSKSSYPDERALVAQDTLSWVRGAHLFKAGVNFDHLSDAVGALVNQAGTYSYPNVLNFILFPDMAAAIAAIRYAEPSRAIRKSNANCDSTGRVYDSNRGRWPGRARRSALLFVVFAACWTVELASEHQRSGGLCHRTMATRR